MIKDKRSFTNPSKNEIPLIIYEIVRNRHIDVFYDVDSVMANNSLGELLNIEIPLFTNEMPREKPEDSRDLYSKEYQHINDTINTVTNNLKTINCKYIESVKPVTIFISGSYNTLYTTILSLVIKAHLENRNRKVVLLSDYDKCKIPALNLYGKKLEEASLSSNDISILNLKLKAIQMNLNPEYIIFDIPGGMMRANQYYMNDYGIPLWSTMQAVRPDFYLNVVPYTLYNNAYEEMVNTYLGNNFNTKTDYFCITNESYDFISSRVDKLPEVQYRNIRRNDFINNLLNNNQIISVNKLFDDKKIKSIIDKLESYLLDCK